MKKPNLSIIFVCQRGEIELKAALLAASLRESIGAETELIAVIPEVFGSRHIPSDTTLDLLSELEVQITHITNDVVTDKRKLVKGDLLINKAFCLKIPVTSKKLVFIDSDVLCLRPFNSESLLSNAPFQAKPVDHQTYRIWGPIYDLFALARISQMDREFSPVERADHTGIVG